MKVVLRNPDQYTATQYVEGLEHPLLRYDPLGRVYVNGHLIYYPKVGDWIMEPPEDADDDSPWVISDEWFQEAFMRL